MPPGNVTGMTAEERAEIVAWYQSLDRDVAALDQ
jgi:uncharacterized membrane protein